MKTNVVYNLIKLDTRYQYDKSNGYFKTEAACLKFLKKFYKEIEPKKRYRRPTIYLAWKCKECNNFDAFEIVENNIIE